MPCPPKVTVDGLTVKNYEGETFGDVPFTTDFAQSCNTAFVGLSATMADADVHDAATALGVGAGWEKHLGVANAFGGSVPVAASKTEKAATSFGQARDARLAGGDGGHGRVGRAGQLRRAGPGHLTRRAGRRPDAQAVAAPRPPVSCGR